MPTPQAEAQNHLLRIGEQVISNDVEIPQSIFDREELTTEGTRVDAGAQIVEDQVQVPPESHPQVASETQCSAYHSLC